MTKEEAQAYIIKRGFDKDWNSGEVYVNRDNLIRTVGEILQWADEHPNGFINDKEYLEKIKDSTMTNKEFRDILSEFPDNALISIECCNPRGVVYDNKNNLIRID